jgi:hypothetical protein
MFIELMRSLSALINSPAKAVEIERHFVQSLSIVAAGYDRTTRTLQFEYFNGLVCEAYDVPETTYDKLRNSKCFDRDFDHLVASKFELHRVARLLPVFAG